MNTRNVSDLLLKIGGMLIILLTISDVNKGVFAYSEHSVNNFSLFVSIVVFPNILPLLLGFFLFMKPEKVSNVIIAHNEEESTRQNVFLAKIESLGLSILGFYLLFQALSDIIYHLSNFVLINIKSQPEYGAVFSLTQFVVSPTIITTVGELTLSLLLIFKVKGIIKIVQKFRE